MYEYLFLSIYLIRVEFDTIIFIIIRIIICIIIDIIVYNFKYLYHTKTVGNIYN